LADVSSGCPSSGPDGKAETPQPGYQSETGSYYLPPAGFAIPEVPETPTPGENRAKLGGAASRRSYSAISRFVGPSRTAQTRRIRCRRPSRFVSGNLHPGPPTPLPSESRSRTAGHGRQRLLASVLALPATLGRMGGPRIDRGRRRMPSGEKRLHGESFLESPRGCPHIDNVRGRLPVARTRGRSFTSDALGGSESSVSSRIASGSLSTLAFQSSPGTTPYLATENWPGGQSAFGWMPAWNGRGCGTSFFRHPDLRAGGR